jgi:hypothetical protein
LLAQSGAGSAEDGPRGVALDELDIELSRRFGRCKQQIEILSDPSEDAPARRVELEGTLSHRFLESARGTI